jgi:hypothetical protein
MARLRNRFVGKKVLVATGVVVLAAVAAGVAPSFSARSRAARKERRSSVSPIIERDALGRSERSDPAPDSRLALLEARLAGLGDQVGETARVRSRRSTRRRPRTRRNRRVKSRAAWKLRK